MPLLGLAELGSGEGWRQGALVAALTSSMAPERQAKARRFSSELSTSDISDSSSYSASSSHLCTCVLRARELEPWHALTEAPQPLSLRSERLVLSARARGANQPIRPEEQAGAGRAAELWRHP